MKWWRIRKLANAGAWSLMLIGVGVMGGLMLSVALVGIPRAEHPPIVGPYSIEYLDLIVQRSMSDAGWLMVVITAFSTLVGGLGLYLIARTLQEAKRSADAAHMAVAAAQGSAEIAERIGQAQTRAYIVISSARIKPDEADRICVKFTFRNSGQTPARGVYCWYELYCSEADGEMIRIDEDFESRSDLPSGEDREADFPLSRHGLNVLRREVESGGATIQLDIKIDFVDVFDKELTTYASYYCHLGRGESLASIGTLYRDETREF